MGTSMALVRKPGPELAQGLSAHEGGVHIDHDRALVQHGAYVHALRSAGLEVMELPSLPGYPDSCFVEDCVVVLGGRALVSRPGAPSRQGEVDSVASALAPYLSLDTLFAPATLDGGDVMRLGERFFVGDSGRSNEAGRAALTAFAAADGFTVTSIPVRGALHLKSITSPAAQGVVLVLEETIDPAVFQPAHVISVPRVEARAANVLDLGEVVVMPPGCPQTRGALEALGLKIIEVDASEFAYLDGALTCLSVLFQAWG